jgi:hypothetical protein
VYGDTTISFDADFDANTVTVGDEVVALDGVNTVLVDTVDRPGAQRIYATRWIEPRLPLVGDMNLLVVQRSRELLDYLRCEVPMPTPPATGVPILRIPITTVCEKLKAK